MNLPQTFEQAREVINTKPLPADTFDRLDKLRKKTPRKFRRQFDDLYEAAMAMDDEGVLL